MIPKKIYIRELDIDIFDQEVNLTRAWVANKPCTGRREYTDLSQVWHAASEEPKNGEFILVEVVNTIPTRNDTRYFIEYSEEWMVKLMKTDGFKCRWAYIKDLLPKGGIK